MSQLDIPSNVLDGNLLQHFISQSEVDSYLNCQMKHYYAFGEPNADGSKGIQPVTHSESLTRGTLGHEALACYYSTIISGGTLVEAKRAAVVYLAGEAAKGDPFVISIVNQLLDILSTYFTYYADELHEWAPLVVEREFRYEVPGSNMIFPFRPDGIFRHKPTGELVVWDHKFLYNFYQERTLPIQPQLPKYVHVLRLLGFNIKGAMYNQISTRKNTKKPFNRLPVGINDGAARRFFEEQVDAMHRIRAQKERHPLVWKESSLRTASAFNCKSCPFLDVCTADLEEQNGRDLLVASFYGPNKYGYGKEVEAIE